MTGTDLKQIMEKLNLSGADVANISGVSRGYISQLLTDDAIDGDIPASTVAKLRSGFLRYHQEVAAAYFTIEGEYAGDAA